MPAFTTLPVDTITGAIGKRPSGAPLYHRGFKDREHDHANATQRNCPPRQEVHAECQTKAYTTSNQSTCGPCKALRRGRQISAK